MQNRRHALMAATVAAGVLCSAGAAFAADDGYQDVFSSVLTAVGLLSPDKTPDIDYRERAPLVLPPKMTLDKPTDGSAHNAAWPQDPDVARRHREASEARAPRNTMGNESLRVSKEELMKGRMAREDSAESPDSEVRHSACGNQGNQRNCLVVSPDELKAMDEKYQASGQGEKKEIVAGEEPDRLYLTQPPKGYLKVTKTVKATVEAPKEHVDEADPKNELKYHEHNDD